MPQYYNPYLYNNPSPAVGAAYFNAYPQQALPMNNSYGMPTNNYWISVDGEMAARAWQMPANLPPNTIIPLWDLDGQHVYFKSTDAYGRINPIRKGKVVFEDEQAGRLPSAMNEGQSESCAPAPSSINNTPDMNGYVRKEDFEGLRQEIREMLQHQRELAQASVNAITGDPTPVGGNTQDNKGYQAPNGANTQSRGDFVNNQNGNNQKQNRR